MFGCVPHCITVVVLTAVLAPYSQPAASCSGGALPLYKQKRYAEAERLLQTCLSVRPDDAASHELLGLVFAESGAPDRAAEHLRQALKLAETNDDYRFNLAMFLAKADRIQEADEAAQPLLRSRPTPDVYSLIGYIRLRQRQEREAADWFEKVVAAVPNNSEAWYRLAFCRQSLGEFTPAESAYLKTIALDPRHALARLQLGKILLLRGDYAKAIDQLQESARLDPARSSTWRYLSQSQMHSGKIQDAQNSAHKAVELAPSDPRSHHQLGLVLSRLGDDADAEVEFRTVEKLRAEQHMGAKPADPKLEDD